MIFYYFTIGTYPDNYPINLFFLISAVDKITVTDPLVLQNFPKFVVRRRSGRLPLNIVSNLEFLKFALEDHATSAEIQRFFSKLLFQVAFINSFILPTASDNRFLEIKCREF